MISLARLAMCNSTGSFDKVVIHATNSRICDERKFPRIQLLESISSGVNSSKIISNLYRWRTEGAAQSFPMSLRPAQKFLHRMRQSWHDTIVKIKHGYCARIPSNHFLACVDPVSVGKTIKFTDTRTNRFTRTS